MKPVGHSLLQRAPSGEFDAIVIGSGLSGLVTASLLAREGGKRVLVLERHYRIGGFTHVFTRPGYEWDVGVHYVGKVGQGELLRSMFDRVSDGALEWAPLPEVYDAIELGSPSRRYELKRGLEGLFPEKRPALERYVKVIEQTARKAQLELFNRVRAPAPRLASHRLAPIVPEWARKTTREGLAELGFTDDVEVAVLTGQYGDYGPGPSRSAFALHSMVVDHYLHGAWYPVGGASRFAQTIAPAIEKAGGHLAHSADVKRIVVEGERAVGVELADGRVFRAPLIVSAAGAQTTFCRLLEPEHQPRELTSALRAATSSSAYACLYLGLKGTDAELGLTGTNLWLHADEFPDASIERFDADSNAPFPVVYLSFPSAKDPDFQRRHPGRATLEAICMLKWEWFERWADTRWQKRGADYDAFKARLQQRLLDAVLERLPQLRGKIAHAEISTPLSTAHFAGHARGEAYGLEATPARYRVPLRAQTHLEGLFFTGVDLATAGVAGAVIAGSLTAGAILGPQKLWEWFPLERAFRHS
ncbi:MAG: NAD(P)/FAD-dependent oxidoreductase [Archangium sp.]